jgi:hypothetical protein
MIETCPYCREAIEGPDAIRCPSCGTPHHKACFGENGGCTVFGCASAPSDAPKIAVTSLDIPTSAPPPPLPTELQSDRTLYFVNRGEEQFGPYSLSELQRYVAEKRVAATDFAWSEGMPQWVFVCDVIGNLSHPTSHSTMSVTAAPGFNAAPEMPTQAGQAKDSLAGRIRFGRGLFFLSMIGLLLTRAAFSGSKDTEDLGTFLFITGWIVIAVLRVRDVGMSGWTVLLVVVPIANLFLCYRLFCAPRGYEITKRADTAMEVICWSFGGLIVLGILIAILLSVTR